MDPRDIYELLRNLTTPLVCVTTAWEGKENGLIINSAIRGSLVLGRPRVAIFLLKRNLTHDLIFASGSFGLHLLHGEQWDLIHEMGFVSGRERDKLTDVPHHAGPTGAPLLEDAYARFDCRVINCMDAGSATCFLGEAVHVERGTGDTLMTSDRWRAGMPPEWRAEYERNLQDAQRWAATFADRIEPVIWPGLHDD